MKKTTALLLIAAPFVFSACKKSKDAEPEPNPPIYELPYNKEGVTANKAFMENEGRDFVKKVNDLSSNTAIDALETFNSLGAPDVDVTVNALSNMGVGSQEIAGIKSVLNTITAPVSEKKAYRLSKAFGIYKYNQSTKLWDLTPSSDKIEFQFPATKNGNTNNTILTVTYKNSGKSYVFNSKYYRYKYDPNTGNVDVTEVNLEETYELPSEVLAKMTIGGSEVLNLTSTYAYHDDKLPKSVNASLSLGSYVAKFEVNNDNKLVATKFSFAKGAETLIALNANTNFSALSYDKVFNSKDDEIFDLFTSANTTFAVGNLTLGGQIDYKAMHSELKAARAKAPVSPNWETYFGSIKYPNRNDYSTVEAYENAIREYSVKWEAASKLYNAAYDKYRSDNEKYEKDYYTLLANLLNKNGAAVAVNTKTKTKIASITFQLKDDVYQWGNTTVHEYNIEPLLVFGDGSKVSFEVFGDTGFEKLIDDIEALLEKFEI
ncbi:hypothetical protein HHL16_04445 [Pseudoflavitalea sp. G-6-1-2]|uniref:hypothetical protein n=1 Tax=Pseudoflavitalea sp. G-6-1-2 TaxID=2728841 RepID=UPI00146B067C|nr:hypothetical protein [Pseudoflavitalea sp. G-6-1-2]NML20109.1 hypothetical protein [Pseudoflavitalea sp. G-6-1-2]